MRRREFIAGLGSAATWPLAVPAQQAALPVIGVLLDFPESDPMDRAFVATVREELAKLGWNEGRNLRIIIRSYENDPDRIRPRAAELVGLAPQAIVVAGAAATRELQRQTTVVPIVFAAVGDPVASGIVHSIARPEGNATGFGNYVQPLFGKLVELLKQAAPRVERVASVFNPEFTVALTQVAPIEAAARALGLNTARIPVRNAAEINEGIDAFAKESNGGLVVVPPPLTFSDRELINQAAVKHRLPTIYGYGFFTSEGGLMSYGPDLLDFFRGAATYVDRILRGAKPGDLPVQFPTRLKLVVNLKTAKAMGLPLSEAFLLRADEVIE